VVTGGIALGSPAAAVGVGLGVVACAALYRYRSFARDWVPPRIRPGRGPDYRRARDPGQDAAISATTVDPAVVLIAAGILHDRPQTAATTIDGQFAGAWEARAAALLHGDPEAVPAALARVAGLPAGPLVLVAIGERVAALLGTEQLATWESPVALCLDVAALELLPSHARDWIRLTVAARSEVAGALRLFLETCPDCGGVVRLEADQGNSPPREVTPLVSVRCECCDATIQSLVTGASESKSGDQPTTRRH
jgi:hypothetical protein